MLRHRCSIDVEKGKKEFSVRLPCDDEAACSLLEEVIRRVIVEMADGESPWTWKCTFAKSLNRKRTCMFAILHSCHKHTAGECVGVSVQVLTTSYPRG